MDNRPAAKFHGMLSRRPMHAYTDDSCPTVNVLPKPLFSADQLAVRVAELGHEISATLPPGPIHVVGILRGAFVFMADLVRAIGRETRCDFLAVRSYG
jgi:hypoxanthine phosphoribosyltransferase